MFPKNYHDDNLHDIRKTSGGVSETRMKMKTEDGDDDAKTDDIFNDRDDGEDNDGVCLMSIYTW